MAGFHPPRPASRISVGDLARFAEAAILLGLAALMIRFLAFRLVVRTTRIARERRMRPVGAVVLAIRRASRRVPWRTVCFHEGLVALWMLRLRGVPARLHYGARSRGDMLTAHVWVTVDGAVVIGEEWDAPHALLATFPE